MWASRSQRGRWRARLTATLRRPTTWALLAVLLLVNIAVTHTVLNVRAQNGAPLISGVTVPAGGVWLKGTVEGTEEERQKLRKHVANKIGAIARPEQIIFTADLPKTRSAKIMRRLLRDIAAGRVLGDTTTLADPAVVNDLKQQYEKKGLTE